MGSLRGSSIDAQVSLIDRPSRPGKESAWATERRVMSDTKERMLVARMEQKKGHGRVKAKLVHF